MKVVPLVEVKAHLSALLSEVESEQEQITVTRNGVPAAMVISVAEWELVRETLAVLSDSQAVTDLRESHESRVRHSTDEVLAELAARRTQTT